MKNSSKCLLLLSFLPFIISGCTTPVKKDIKTTVSHSKSIILNPQQPPQPMQRKIWISQPPADYLVWLSKNDNKQRVQEYQKYLEQNRVHTAVPTYQLLRSARSWEKCGRDPYAIPSSEIWGNALPTLKIIQYLVDTDVLREIEITSVYRDYSLNQCAGGAAGSKHVYNAAIDFRVGPESYPTSKDMILLEDTKIKLCKFWHEHGEKLNMGLGVYASGQIHIDTQGYRTWGPDHSSKTSMCNY